MKESKKNGPKKIDVFEVTIYDQKIIETSVKIMLAFIQAEIENMDFFDDEPLEIKIVKSKMAQKAFNELPEFDGF